MNLYVMKVTFLSQFVTVASSSLFSKFLKTKSPLCSSLRDRIVLKKEIASVVINKAYKSLSTVKNGGLFDSPKRRFRAKVSSFLFVLI